MGLQKIAQKCEEIVAAQQAHLLLWATVAFACGCGLYFSLNFEPRPLALYAVTGALISLTSFVGYKVYRSHDAGQYLLFIFLVAICFLMAGGAASSLRTHFLNTPLLVNTPQALMVEGSIREIERDPFTGHATLILEKIKPYNLKKIRLTSRLKGNPFGDVDLNDRVQILVKLSPPSRPVIVGGFDFQRYSFFQGLSAQGFVLQKPQIISKAPKNIFSLEKKRAEIHQRLRDQLPPHIAGIANALMTGERADIAEDDWESLRASGLAHIISISGLHVVMVAAPVFFIVRLFLVMIPYCALYWPVKKIAALIALLVCCAYVGFVVPSVPSTRALLMTGLGLIAIMLDRSPFSLRLIAFAAFVVLLFYPESIWSASFQLSFAAVISLVWIAEVTRNFWMRQKENASFVTATLLWFSASIVTSFVVALATSPLTSFHFQQIAVYSVVANALAIPITGLLIMPMIILSFALLPFEFGNIPIEILGFGIESLLAIANMVASWPFAIWNTPSWSPVALLFLTFAGLFLFLGIGRAWILSVPCLVMAIIFILITPQPMMHISGNGKQVIVKNESQAVLSARRSEGFMTQTALQHMDVTKFDFLPKEGRVEFKNKASITCGVNACRYELPFVKITAGKNMQALLEDCAWADVIITTEKFNPKTCEAEIFDRKRFYQTGAIAIYKDGDSITVRDTQGVRPWTTWRGQGVWLETPRRPKEINDMSAKETPIPPEFARDRD